VRCCSFAPRGRCGRDTARLRRWWLACTATSLPSSKVGCTSHVDGVQPSSQCVTHSLSSPPTGVAGRVLQRSQARGVHGSQKKTCPDERDGTLALSSRHGRVTWAFWLKKMGEGRRPRFSCGPHSVQRNPQSQIRPMVSEGQQIFLFVHVFSRRHSPGRACMDAPRTS